MVYTGKGNVKNRQVHVQRIQNCSLYHSGHMTRLLKGMRKQPQQVHHCQVEPMNSTPQELFNKRSENSLLVASLFLMHQFLKLLQSARRSFSPLWSNSNDITVTLPSVTKQTSFSPLSLSTRIWWQQPTNTTHKRFLSTKNYCHVVACTCIHMLSDCGGNGDSQLLHYPNRVVSSFVTLWYFIRLQSRKVTVSALLKKILQKGAAGRRFLSPCLFPAEYL